MYMNKVDFKATITNPEENVTYLSLHSKNRLLTRVIVVKVYENEYLDVFNIDDLEFERIQILSIKPLPNLLQKFNPIMTFIKLFNIECCKEKCEHPSDVLHRIITLTHHKRLYAVIRQFVDKIPVVEIYEENYTNLIYQELIDEGYFVRPNEALVEQLR